MVRCSTNTSRVLHRWLHVQPKHLLRNIKRTWHFLSFPSSGLLRGLRWFKAEVSGLPIVPIFKGQPLKRVPIGNRETSVLNQLTLRNNPKDGRMQFSHSRSLRSRRESAKNLWACRRPWSVWPLLRLTASRLVTSLLFCTHLITQPNLSSSGRIWAEGVEGKIWVCEVGSRTELRETTQFYVDAGLDAFFYKCCQYRPVYLSVCI
jgi:hypothetical protein